MIEIKCPLIDSLSSHWTQSESRALGLNLQCVWLRGTREAEAHWPVLVWPTELGHRHKNIKKKSSLFSTVGSKNMCPHNWTEKCLIQPSHDDCDHLLYNTYYMKHSHLKPVNKIQISITTISKSHRLWC